MYDCSHFIRHTLSHSIEYREREARSNLHGKISENESSEKDRETIVRLRKKVKQLGRQNKSLAAQRDEGKTNQKSNHNQRYTSETPLA